VDSLLLLLTNLLSIPDAPPSNLAAAKFSTLQDDFLLLFDRVEGLRLLIAMTQMLTQPTYSKFTCHILAIMHWIYNQQDPVDLAKIACSASGTTDTALPNPTDHVAQAAKKLVLTNALASLSTPKVTMSARHSRFGGTFLKASKSEVLNTSTQVPLTLLIIVTST